MESTLTLLIYIVVFLLTIDWIIDNIFQSRYDSYRNKVIFIKILFYTFAILYMWYSTMYCLSNWREIHNVIILRSLKFLIIYIILLHVFHYIYSRRRNLLLRMDFTLILPTTLMLCWLPYLMVHVFVLSMNSFLVVGIHFFAQCCESGNAIVNVYLLAKTESEFKKKFLEVVKCRCMDQFQSQYSNVYAANNTNRKS
ncbi:hypothetical protein BDFB_009026 [Asbolus verrucosus]|uniref:Uncharacterized protein n=1 Tax=Asbolus verrucosus TaxID=1661398 RepID=A0A482VKQ3_ASBVE|nr:hypothetical protein BDFB_009026 [Asbolus verrucosus]